MSNTSMIDIKIYPNGMTEIAQEINQIKRIKTTDISNLATFLANCSSGFSPLLPEGTIKYGFKNTRIKALISFDEVLYRQKYEIYGSSYCSDISMSDFYNISDEFDDYEDDEEDGGYVYSFDVNTYLPKCIWLVEFFEEGGKYKINAGGCRLFYYFDDLLVGTTKLYAFPFGNVFGNNELCFGGIEILYNQYKSDDLRGARSIYSHWMNSVSNTDLTYKIKDHSICFDHIYDYGNKLHGVKSLNELKSDDELYRDTRNMLKELMLDEGITFNNFLVDRMS